MPGMDDLPNLISEISTRYPDGVPIESLESYCRRYLHFYHRHVQAQPVRFLGLALGRGAILIACCSVRNGGYVVALGAKLGQCFGRRLSRDWIDQTKCLKGDLSKLWTPGECPDKIHTR